MIRFVVPINTEGVISCPGDYLIVILSDTELVDLISLFATPPPTAVRNASGICWKNWFPCKCFYSSLNFSLATLPNGDTVGNHLERNGYCFLPEETRIPPGSFQVTSDIFLDIENKTMKFVFAIEEGSGSLYSTIPFDLNALNTIQKYKIGSINNEQQQKYETTEEVGKCDEGIKSSGFH